MSNDHDQLRIGVVGMGAVGSTLAAHLIEAGAFVVPCDIDQHKIDKIRHQGIRLKHIIEMETEVKEAYYSVQELEMYDLNFIIIAVKTPHLAKVVTQLSEIDTDKTFIMCAQNGLDNELEVATVFGADKTLRMVINYAGNMSELNTVHVSFFNPPNYVAALTPTGKPIAQKLAALLNSVNLTIKITKNIRKYVWEKVILNAALAPVCAITKLTMKEVMDSPQGLGLVQAIIDESICVAEADGIELGENFPHFCIRYLKGGGHHRPSMSVDIENGHPTEIDHMNGRIAEYGRKYSISSPINEAITALVHLQEYSLD